MWCYIQRNARPTRDPCGSAEVECLYSEGARPSKTNRSPMIQPNRRRRIPPPAMTHPELNRMFQAHARCELRRLLCTKQGFIIAVPWGRRSPTGVRVDAQSRWHPRLRTPWRPNRCDPAPQTVDQLSYRGLSLWSDCCFLTVLVRAKTRVPWRDPGHVI